MNALGRRISAAIALAATLGGVQVVSAEHSVARQWNELMLDAVRNDFARPTVHARNLYHVSMAMWDGWAAYDCVAAPYLTQEPGATTNNVDAGSEPPAPLSGARRRSTACQ